jgi:hypothetical protein
MVSPEVEQDPARQYTALVCLNDELMSLLHAHVLQQDTVPSETVIAWLRSLYDIVQEGLGKPKHFQPSGPS